MAKTLGLEDIHKSIPKRNGISSLIAYFPGALIMLNLPITKITSWGRTDRRRAN